MPPRTEALRRLGTVQLCLRPGARPAPPSSLLAPRVQTASLSLREKKIMAKQDPYRWAQAQQRKTANLKRREELGRERAEALGDPILGKPTPFLELLDVIGTEKARRAAVKDDSTVLDEGRDRSTSAPKLRNHYITDRELDEAVQYGYALTKPVAPGVVTSLINPALEKQVADHNLSHQRAVEAMRRITALENGSARDRFHVKVHRIIDEFGRHQTDKFLKPKPQSISPATVPMPGRAGPDTGSSEVQIAILTSKIRAVSQALSVNRGHKDKHNHRNLRVLVHRRQKLLRYMERKERGSERWRYMLEKLGLTPASWKGEISL